LNKLDGLHDGWLVNLGQAEYLEVLDLQRGLAQLRHEHRVPDTLLLVEHEPVITMGRRDTKANILATPAELATQGIQVHQVERGGDVTYHGPGQLVGYPIIHIAGRKLGLHQFVSLLEESIIRTLADFNISGVRDPAHRGVWVNGLKVAALGVAVKRWVSFHGIALNVSPNLEHFCLIKPCDLDHTQVTSMAAMLGGPPRIDDVKEALVKRFTELFPAQWCPLDSAELAQKIRMHTNTPETVRRNKQGESGFPPTTAPFTNH
jgi:lipoate-protein ligase B